MAKKGRGINRRKPGGTRPYLALVVVLAVIAAALLVLELTRKKAPPVKEGHPPEQASHLKMPDRKPPQHERMTSAAALPPHKETPVTPRHAGHGSVALIIDDMGSSLQEARSLLSIGQPLTFSIIPSLSRAKAVAEAVHGAGAEVMVHMPMEPKGYPQQRMEKIGLLLSMDDAEVEKRVRGYLEVVPYASGANNHMGSRFTEDGAKMETVLKVLKEKKLFFVDSRTSPASVGYETARELGLRCASRQVFLDNVQDEKAIGKQLLLVAALARKKGEAIAIGHPHPATIKALQEGVPELTREGIRFVPVSALVH